jgi:hypothetical protein
MTLKVLEDALEHSSQFTQVGADFVILGDLYDDVRPLPQSIAAVVDLFEKYRGTGTILKGNHDNVSETAGDHALGPLKHTCNVEDVPRCVFGFSVLPIYLPFIAEPAEDWVPETVATLLAETVDPHQERVLMLHCGIHDAAMRKASSWDMAAARDAISVETLVEVCRKHRISKVFAGNWHTYRSWQFDDGRIQIYQVGALVPTGWDNPGLFGYGGLLFLDGDGVVTRHEIAGPRFLNVTEAGELLDAIHTVRAYPAQAGTYSLFVRWRCGRSDRTAALAKLAELKELGQIHAFEVPPNTEAAGELVVQVAKTLRHDVTLATAVDTAVGAVSLPEGVQRHRVAELTRRFLRVGA